MGRKKEEEEEDWWGVGMSKGHLLPFQHSGIQHKPPHIGTGHKGHLSTHLFNAI